MSDLPITARLERARRALSPSWIYTITPDQMRALQTLPLDDKGRDSMQYWLTARRAAEQPVCRVAGCDGVAVIDGCCLQCWEEISALQDQDNYPPDWLSDLGGRMLDDPAWVRGFLWLLVFCLAGLIISQTAIKLGWIER